MQFYSSNRIKSDYNFKFHYRINKHLQLRRNPFIGGIRISSLNDPLIPHSAAGVCSSPTALCSPRFAGEEQAAKA